MFKAVLFDLDGTLADTARDLGGALNALLAEHNRPSQPYENIRPIASHGARGLINLGFGIDRDHPDFCALRERFLALYDQRVCQETVLFDGVIEMINALHQQNLRWGIVTNKPGAFTTQLMAALPFPVPPAVVVSGDTTAAPKPDPRPMLHAASEINIPPVQCVYVGDAERDITAGRVTGMRTVLASWGYIAAEENPYEWGADITIDHPMELLRHLD